MGIIMVKVEIEEYNKYIILDRVNINKGGREEDGKRKGTKAYI